MQQRSNVELKLGIPQLSAHQMTIEIAERIRCARLWCQKHRQTLCDPSLHCQAKFQLYKFFVRPILTYGCEVWTMNDSCSRKLIRFECATLLEIYKSKYPHRHPKRLRPNLRAVYKRYRDTDVVDYVCNKRLNWSQLLRIEEIALGKCRRRRSRVYWWDEPPMISNRTRKDKPNATSSGSNSNLPLTIKSSNTETGGGEKDTSREAPG